MKHTGVISCALTQNSEPAYVMDFPEEYFSNIHGTWQRSYNLAPNAFFVMNQAKQNNW